ncbi:MAG: DUF211 domain-containing protein [Candidatus Woesearchaeota archaeon]
MSNVRLLVLDVLKPHEPIILKLASTLADLKGVDGVDISVYEIDSKVENVKITIQGQNLNYNKIKEIIEENGAAIHSIDKVTCGAVLIEEVTTHQDD